MTRCKPGDLMGPAAGADSIRCCGSSALEAHSEMRLTVGRLLTFDRNAFLGWVDEKHAGFSFRKRRGDQNPLGDVRAGYAFLGSVENEGLAVRLRGGQWPIERIVAELTHRAGQQCAAVDDAGKPALLLILGSEMRERERTQNQAGQCRYRRHGTTDFLKKQTQRAETESASSSGFGESDPQQVGFREFRPQAAIDTVFAFLDPTQVFRFREIREDLAREIAHFLLFVCE